MYLVKVDCNNEFAFHYKDKYIEATKYAEPHLFSAGKVQLINIGSTLMNLIKPSHNDAIFQYILSGWLKEKCIVQVNNTFLK